MNLLQIGTQFDQYPSLLFVPVGRKHAGIRSIGHKEEKAILSRLQTLVADQFAHLTPEESIRIQQFLGTDRPLLPVPVYKHEQLFPQLIQPEMFLWQKPNRKQSLPLQSQLFYKKEYGTLSADDLASHIKAVIADYLFCAKLAEHAESEWINRIGHAYTHHPFIQLASRKEPIVHAVETMNKSALLGVFKSPEDVAFWRHRVEIVLRPYRQIPADWKWSMCSHPKHIQLDATTETIHCTCATCGYSIQYQVNSNSVVLPNEVDIAQATKRIATIERQLNDLAKNSSQVILRLQLLQELNQLLAVYQERLRTIQSLQQTLGQPTTLTHPIIECFEAVSSMTMPTEPIEPALLSLAQVVLPDITVLKNAEEWKSLFTPTLRSELEELKHELHEYRLANAPKHEDTLFAWKEYHFTRGMLEHMAPFPEKESLNVTMQLLVQVLTGEATSKIRSLGLHEHSVFGMLADWPAKVVTKLIFALEENGYIHKEQKRYAIKHGVPLQ